MLYVGFSKFATNISIYATVAIIPHLSAAVTFCKYRSFPQNIKDF